MLNEAERFQTLIDDGAVLAEDDQEFLSRISNLLAIQVSPLPKTVLAEIFSSLTFLLIFFILGKTRSSSDAVETNFVADAKNCTIFKNFQEIFQFFETFCSRKMPNVHWPPQVVRIKKAF